MLWLISFVLLVGWESSYARICENRIHDLPGLNFPIGFNQYSGYLEASPHDKLFYWFVEAENDHQTAPLIIWFNGGPGCSSLDGLLSENGPFLINDDGATVRTNQYSWNKFANVVYLESPVGVGFSHSTSAEPNSDIRTAALNYGALRDFFRKFPALRKNDLYLAGESYGGVYVPTLAERLFDDGTFNLKGFTIGNGRMDAYLNDKAYLIFLLYHGLLSKESWNDIVENCCTNYTADECNFSMIRKGTQSCAATKSKAEQALYGINQYNVGAECYREVRKSGRQAAEMKKNLMDSGWSGAYPCLNNTAVTTYLNDVNVQTALHVENPPRPWKICSGQIFDTYNIQYKSVKDIFLKLLPTNKLKVLIYNGLLDSMCPYLSAEWFVDGLSFKVLEDWSQWTSVGSFNHPQVGGFVKKFDHNLTLVKIKGAGHSVPIDKPKEIFEVISEFILN